MLIRSLQKHRLELFKLAGIAVGAASLPGSKNNMAEFFYNHMQKLYPERINMV
jgi:hypothetical protein